RRGAVQELFSPRRAALWETVIVRYLPLVVALVAPIAPIIVLWIVARRSQTRRREAALDLMLWWSIASVLAVAGIVAIKLFARAPVWGFPTFFLVFWA